MYTEDMHYCKRCKALHPSAYALNNGWGGYTWYCANCHSRLSSIGPGIHKYGNSLVVIGNITGNLVIPEGVTQIEGRSLENTSVRSVQFPRSLKEIPYGCFSGCRSLEEVTLPTTVIKIGSGVFEGCTALKKVTINGNVDKVSFSAFKGCTSLQQITINGNVDEVCSSAFEGCTSLQQITINGNVNEIGVTVFEDCRALRELVINGNVYWSYGFGKNKSVEKITIGRNVTAGRIFFSRFCNLKTVVIQCPVKKDTEVSEMIRFFGCENLETVEIACAEEIQSKMFSGLDKLKKIELPNTIKRIGDEAFANCTMLETIRIPEGCIELSGFNGCTNLKRIAIPNSVKKIGHRAFEKCTGIELLTIPEGVEELGNYAFSQCENIRDIILPSTIKNIGNYAFCGCKKLEKIVLPVSLVELGESAFAACTKISLIKLPSSLKRIGKNVIDGTRIKTIMLPKGITKLDDQTFQDERRKASNQKYTYIVARNSYAEKHFQKLGIKHEIMSMTSGFFAETPIVDGILYFIKSTKTQLELPENVEIVESYAVSDQGNTECVVISDSVKEVKSNAFADCEKLEKVVFGCNLEIIGSNAFPSVCNCLVNLPETIKKIAPDAFGSGCVLSVNGEMPFYDTQQSIIEEMKKDIETQKRNILNLEKKLVEHKNNFAQYSANRPNCFFEVESLTKEIETVTDERDRNRTTICCSKGALVKLILEIDEQIKSINEEIKKNFFLNISRKINLRKQIASKEKELKDLKAKQEILDRHYANDETIYEQKLYQLEKRKQQLLEACRLWESGLLYRKNAIENCEQKIIFSRNTITQKEAEVRKESKKLEKAHAIWQEARTKAIQLTEKKQQEERELKKKQKLLDERKQLLAKLIRPKFETIPTYPNNTQEGIVEEVLLNDAFLNMIHDLNERSCVLSHNQFVETNAQTIERIREINMHLGYDACQDIADLVPLESIQSCENYVPERFARLSTLFAQTEHWKQFKTAVAEFKHKKNIQAKLQKEFFSKQDYLLFINNNQYLLMFPYCLVIYGENKPFVVLTYDQAKVSVQCKETEQIVDVIPPYGELIRERHQHLNMDGSISRRYKDNPIIKMIRFTTVTIKNKRKVFSFPVKCYSDALRFEQLYNHYCGAVSTELMGEIYQLVVQSANLSDLEVAFNNLTKEKRKRQKLEKKKLAEEARAFEEAQRATEIAAEEKKKELILRQRELNEERRRQLEEKQKRMQLFEDNSLVETESVLETTRNDGTEIFSVVGNLLVSNNVFKVMLKQKVETSVQDYIVHFVSETEEIISNKRKFSCGNLNDEITVGFILNAGIDYTKMKRCYMEIEVDGVSVQRIEFKMNIAFYSDF